MNKLVSATLASALGLVLVAPAHAVVTTYGFDNLSLANTFGDGLNSLFEFDVSDVAPNQVQFLFRNKGTTAGQNTITQIAFSPVAAGILSSIFSVTGFTGSPSNNAVPVFNPPAGNFSQSPWIETAASNALGLEADPPPVGKGIQAGESLQVVYDLFVGKTYNDLTAALGTSDIVGIHVQQLTGSGQSDSYVNGRDPIDPAPEVPEPSSILGTALLGGFGLKSYLKKRKNLQTTANEA